VNTVKNNYVSLLLAFAAGALLAHFYMKKATK
jgi:uncharacterized membrane protein affecting hemolysin expression